MKSILASLKPELLWKHFDEVRKIPRASKDETRIAEYILGVAERLGLESDQDAAGNVVVRKAGSPGRENAVTLVLQGHMDMVCEKNADVEHDFTTDPIEIERDGEYITAKQTTLGADNGIGLAAALAVMEEISLDHGPLEMLFTVDEETGLTGANELGSDFLAGRILLNMDSEEEDSLCVGCAGGADSTITLPIKRAAARDGSELLRVSLKGLRGGHSGVDIHEQRGNANQLLARALWKAGRAHTFQLAVFKGGSKRNAIPREAEALLYVAGDAREAFEAALRAAADEIAAEIKPIDPGFELSVAVAAEADGSAPFDEASRKTLLNLLFGLPHGVLVMSHDIPGLVETSTNLATVDTFNDKVALGMNSRSSVQSAIQATKDKIRAVSELAGASLVEGGQYPGWKPNMKSPALKAMKTIHKKLFDIDPTVEVIHAGLECGIIGEKYPGMDMISFGPQIENPHSPDERVQIGSVEKFWKLLVATLDEMSR